jgi:hypothetical protein
LRTHIRGTMKTNIWQYAVGRWWCFWLCAALQCCGEMMFLGLRGTSNASPGRVIQLLSRELLSRGLVTRCVTFIYSRIVVRLRRTTRELLWGVAEASQQFSNCHYFQ